MKAETQTLFDLMQERFKSSTIYRCKADKVLILSKQKMSIEQLTGLKEHYQRISNQVALIDYSTKIELKFQ